MPTWLRRPYEERRVSWLYRPYIDRLLQLEDTAREETMVFPFRRKIDLATPFDSLGHLNSPWPSRPIIATSERRRTEISLRCHVYDWKGIKITSEKEGLHRNGLTKLRSSHRKDRQSPPTPTCCICILRQATVSRTLPLNYLTILPDSTNQNHLDCVGKVSRNLTKRSGMIRQSWQRGFTHAARRKTLVVGVMDSSLQNKLDATVGEIIVMESR